MAIIGRLNKLEQRAKPLQDEIKRKKEEDEWKKELFTTMNDIMEEHHPEHGWSKLSIEKRLEVYNRPCEKKFYFRPNCPIPFAIPQKEDKYDKLCSEALRLCQNILWDEIQRRREEKFLKDDAEYKKMRIKYKYN